MTLEQEQNAKHLGRRAAEVDLRDERRPDPEWWAAEKSYKLGIVDNRGCFDLSNPIARAFMAAYSARFSRG